MVRFTTDFTRKPVFLAAVSAAELLHGVHRANTAVRKARREAFVENILRILHTVLTAKVRWTSVASRAYRFRLWRKLSAPCPATRPLARQAVSK